MARNRRISDNDRHWGPFTLAKCGSYRSFGAHLDSGAGEYPGCNFNVLVGRWWFRVDLPPIIKPWRQWVDMTKYAWASGAGYWDEHARKYGIGEIAAVELLESWGARRRATVSGDFILSWD